MRGDGSVGCCALALLIVCSGAVNAGEKAAIESKAVELGLSGSFTSVEGVSTVAVGLRLGQYRHAGPMALQYALGLVYYSVSDTDELGIEGALSLFYRLSDSSAYAFAGVAGALRQEWTGSFSHDRYAVGIDLGIKMLASRTAAGTVTYRYRRILNDPVSNYNEHGLSLGISILFGNKPSEEGDE